AVVLAPEERPGEHRLVAYAVPAGEAADPAGLTVGVAADLARSLPEFMVPGDIVWLESLPLTPNGKVDRRALAGIAPGRRQGASTVAPRTPIEEVIAGIWQELLGLDAVGVHDSFFHLGGHSLLATQLVSRVRSTFQVELPLRRLFEEPTVEALAAAVVAGEAKPGQSEKIARVLMRIKGLPEDARRAARTSA
ncbi:MAG TPA: phosphopantetheine-binding protein, partial [Thermoanaerobaculia bacterium]|nr:phosphopantetheine-binding protein [Thermoanaerobaculia bacterium]